MPDTPPPESLPSYSEQERFAPYLAQLPAGLREMATSLRPIELKHVEHDDDLFHPTNRRPTAECGFGRAGRCPPHKRCTRVGAGYASDYAFVTTSLMPGTGRPGRRPSCRSPAWTT